MVDKLGRKGVEKTKEQESRGSIQRDKHEVGVLWMKELENDIKGCKKTWKWIGRKRNGTKDTDKLGTSFLTSQNLKSVFGLLSNEVLLYHLISLHHV